MTGYQVVGAAMILLPILAVIAAMFREVADMEGVVMAAAIIVGVLFVIAWVVLGAYLMAGV